jgi:hypothetical protein
MFLPLSQKQQAAFGQNSGKLLQNNTINPAHKKRRFLSIVSSCISIRTILKVQGNKKKFI